MYDQLHAATFIEEPLGNDRVLIRNSPQRSGARANIEHSLLRTKAIESAFLHEPFHRLVLSFDRIPNIRDFFRQLEGAAGSLASPKRNRRRRAMRIFDAHTAGFNPPDAP